MSEIAFDYLTGCVRLSVNQPPELEESLDAFYQDPNNENWGDQICRTLYHESVHFWQFLASAYLGNMISAEWKRIETYRDSGEITETSELIKQFRQRVNDAPFSAYELCECWARYWDVHTRNPDTIIKEESIDVTLQHDPRGYSGVDYDVLMWTGVESSRYEAPYRWMLEQVAQAPWVNAIGDSDRITKGIASYIIALIFPSVVHSAFGSPDPVTIVCAAIDRIVTKKNIGEEILQHKTGSINFDWLQSWTFCLGEIIYPILKEQNMPTFTSGIDVITRGYLKTHPIFPAYLSRLDTLGGMINMENAAKDNIAATAKSEYEFQYRYAMVDAANNDPWVLFAMPGQPNYRYMLGQQMRPPLVSFADKNSVAGQTAFSKLAMLEGKPFDPIEYGAIELHTVKDLEKLVKRFRAAEYAVARGLPANTFDNL
ncbi:hypothetical protein [Kaarinaea lacus]